MLGRMLKWLFVFVGGVLFGDVFDNKLTLAEFGQMANPNTFVQSSSRYTNVSGVFRTNDFQSLQLEVGDYESGRLPCRMGPFLLSVSDKGGQTLPWGLQLSVAGLSNAGNEAGNVPPNSSLKMLQDPNFIIFGFTETDPGTDIAITTNYDASNAVSFQSIDLIFTPDGGGGPMGCHVFQGEPYINVLYETLTPLLTFGGGRLLGLQIDDVDIILPTSGTTIALPAGAKFRFEMDNGDGQPENKQYWLIYVEGGSSPTVQFQMNYALTDELQITDVVLEAAAALSNDFLRLAVIQNETPPANINTLAPKFAPKWQIVTEGQVRPVHSLSQLLLWPQDWLKAVGPQLTRNQDLGIFTSSCTTNSLLIPCLARSDPDAAYCWYVQLVDKMNEGQDVFDVTTNSFNCLVDLLVAKYYTNNFKNFQTRFFPVPESTPKNHIVPTLSAMENMYDSYSDLRPTVANVSIDSTSGNLVYTYEVESISGGAVSGSLVIFPGYKQLSGSSPVSNAVIKDPVKGDLPFTEAQLLSGQEYTVEFAHSYTLPTWAGNGIPNQLWSMTSGEEKQGLLKEMDRLLKTTMPGISVDVLEQARVLYRIAMSAKYILYVSMADLGFLPPYGTTPIPTAVKNRVQPFIDYIENVLEGWLVTRTFNGSPMTNFFIGDSTTTGIIAVRGAASATAGSLDQGNAVYDSHNYQYGYFLFAAAVAAELDQLFGNTAWINEDKTNTVPTTAKMKQFIDMLWRDYANPVSGADDGTFQFARTQNNWEGTSCALGEPSGTVASAEGRTSRNLQSISEDFMGYMGPWYYARAVQNSTALAASQQQGFDVLELYCKTHMHALATGGRALFYNDGNWALKDTAFNFNKTTGIQWDDEATMDISQPRLTPPCYLSREGCIYSNFKLEIFLDDLVDLFKDNCQCTGSKCNCRN